MTAKLVTCSNGHKVKPRPVSYGYPDLPTLEAMERGEPLPFEIGGCVVMDGQPLSICPVCGVEIDVRPPLTRDFTSQELRP